jgi:hypothetical protein
MQPRVISKVFTERYCAWQPCQRIRPVMLAGLPGSTAQKRVAVCEIQDSQTM